MNDRRKKAVKQIVFGAGILIVTLLFYWFGDKAPSAVTSFAECVVKGYPVIESYPRQCKTADGKSFREDIGNELEKDNFIRIAEPRPNATIASPLTIKGVARGSWFFEASFPVTLLDSDGKELTRIPAQAHPSAGGDWMTENFVPFEATFSFTKPETKTGTLILQKNNPSDLQELDDSLFIPVRFRQ